MKSTSAIHPAIMENAENSLVKHTPYISMRESHNALISAMLNSFHSIISCEKCLSNICVPLRVNHKSSPIRGCEEEMGAQRGSKVAP